MALDVTPSQLDLVLYGGDDAVVELTFTDDTGALMDVSGDLEAQVRRSHAAELLASPQIGAAGAAGGVVQVIFAAADTTAFVDDGGSHLWDLQRTANGAVTTLVRGTVKTRGDVTQETP